MQLERCTTQQLASDGTLLKSLDHAADARRQGALTGTQGSVFRSLKGAAEIRTCRSHSRSALQQCCGWRSQSLQTEPQHPVPTYILNHQRSICAAGAGC
jgi:hypothetical protein